MSGTGGGFNSDAAHVGATIDTALIAPGAKKRRKRDRDEAGQNTDSGSIPTKKKKKKHDRDDAGTPVEGTAKKSKKKKKLAIPQPSDYLGDPNMQIDPALLPPTPSSQQQTAALISALAASASNLNPASTQLQPENIFSPLFSPDVPLSSNEDILRALQSLDLSKFAPLLKSIGESAQQVPNTLPFPSQSPPDAYGIPGPSSGVGYTAFPPDFGAAMASYTTSTLANQQIEGNSRKSATSGLRKASNPSSNTPGAESHATILSTKWLNPSKLAEMAERQGLVFRKGKFSQVEEEAIKGAMENYRVAKDLTEGDISDIIFAKGKKVKEQHASFWTDLATSVPQRPLTAVYHYVRRAYHPLKGQGKWTDAEDEALVAAVASFGQAWEQISNHVGRMAGDCRDRYRNHLAHREARNTGPWSKEEEEELTKIVLDMTVNQGKSPDSEVFWGIVSDKMGNRRGRQQVRIKWTDGLSKLHKNDGQNPRWGQQDAYILIQKIGSLNIMHDSEIDWKQLSDKDWNLWSAHTLQRRWQTLKKGIKGSEDMSVAELVAILKEKKLPVGTPAPLSGGITKPKRIPLSHEMVEESSDDDDKMIQPATHMIPLVSTAVVDDTERRAAKRKAKKEAKAKALAAAT